MLQVAVRDEEVEGREYGILAATSAGTSTLTSKEAVPDSPEDDDWDAPRDRTRIPVTAPPDEAEMGPPELTFDGAFGGSPRAGGIDGNMFVLHNAAQDKLSAFDRLMGRNAGARAGAKDTSVYVYPDIPLIRLILKTMSNLLSAARSSGAYSEEYRGELASWLREVEIGPAGEGSSKIRFMRLVRRDETVAFYFNMIANT